MNKKVQFVLRSADINIARGPSDNIYATSSPFGPIERTSDFNGSTGFINRWQSSMRFNNINLRAILGDLYDPKASYNLKLESITFGITSNLNVYSTTQNDCGFNIFMRGLPFASSYSSNLALTNEPLLASVRLPHGSNQFIYTYNNNEISFDLTKNNGCEIVNISIEYRDLLTNLIEPNNAIVAYPHVQFIFSIYKI